jgi:hypothetical protein
LMFALLSWLRSAAMIVSMLCFRGRLTRIR